jgi:DNA polymerase-4
LQGLSDRDAIRKLGEDGLALVHRARGEDTRMVHTGRDTKSVSAETTFSADLTTIPDLERHLWRLSEKLARRLKADDLAAAGVVLKLKTASFSLRTRAARLSAPTVLPDRLFGAARELLAREATGTAFRLIGIGASPLASRDQADHGDLADTETPRLAAAQAAIDALRDRFGENSVIKGRALRSGRIV